MEHIITTPNNRAAPSPGQYYSLHQVGGAVLKYLFVTLKLEAPPPPVWCNNIPGQGAARERYGAFGQL